MNCNTSTKNILQCCVLPPLDPALQLHVLSSKFHHLIWRNAILKQDNNIKKTLISKSYFTTHRMKLQWKYYMTKDKQCYRYQ